MAGDELYQISMITEGKYRHAYTATASDITPLYRLTPNAMLMYFQDSFARLMTIHHVAAFDIVKQHRMWVITEVQMDVQPTLTYWSEDFTVEIWVSELTSLRIYCDFRIVRKDCSTSGRLQGKNEQLIASGTSQWNILNLDTKRLETTDFLADKLAVLPMLMTCSHKKVRFPKPQSFDMLIVHWLHETYLDETLTCHMSHIDDGSYLHTLTNVEGVVVCELMSRWQPQPEIPEVSEVLNRDL